jgi:NitT/TauT family transport system permease protein
MPGRSLLFGSAGLAAFLGGWWLAAAALPPYLFPAPDTVAWTLVRMVADGELVFHLSATLWRTTLAFGLGLVVGVGLGVPMGLVRPLREAVYPVLNALQAIPALHWIFFAIIWFGLVPTSPVFVIFMVTLPIFVISTVEGVKDVDRGLLAMARSFGAGRWLIVQDILIPAILPHVFAAMRVGIGFALKLAMFVEMIMTSRGAGYAATMAKDYAQTEKVFAWTLAMIGVILLFENVIFRQAEARIIRWK